MPEVKHLGDVSDIKGYEIEPVDIITFGSPCQDMSIAGKRAGLNSSRSNLFYEAIRIIDEEDKFVILPYFWLPEETLELRVKRDHVPYDIWERQGYIQTTEESAKYK